MPTFASIIPTQQSSASAENTNTRKHACEPVLASDSSWATAASQAGRHGTETLELVRAKSWCWMPHALHFSRAVAAEAAAVAEAVPDVCQCIDEAPQLPLNPGTAKSDVVNW